MFADFSPRLKLIRSQACRLKNAALGVCKVYFSVRQTASLGIKGYLFGAFLYAYNRWFVRHSPEVKPFIFGDIWRLKGPYISNFCIIVGQISTLKKITALLECYQGRKICSRCVCALLA